MKHRSLSSPIFKVVNVNSFCCRKSRFDGLAVTIILCDYLVYRTVGIAIQSSFVLKQFVPAENIQKVKSVKLFLFC
jgi:hypothetical protein